MNLNSDDGTKGCCGCGEFMCGGKVEGGKGGNVWDGVDVACGAPHPAKNTLTNINPIACRKNFGPFIFVLLSMRLDPAAQRQAYRQGRDLVEKPPNTESAIWGCFPESTSERPHLSGAL
jgi:hypothetical protein